MEKEQIIKALKVCANYQNFGDCDKCPAREGCDTDNNFLERETLSLILEQEKRIEELTIEKAGFEAGAKAVARHSSRRRAEDAGTSVRRQSIK